MKNIYNELKQQALGFLSPTPKSKKNSNKTNPSNGIKD